jgi:ubiquinone/menaquinone biosynthesis C-methylase UbiE
MRGSPAYDLRADIYDSFFGDRSTESECWRKLAAQSGPKVVEWMCGTGTLSIALAQQDFSVIGVDNVQEMLDVAASKPVAGFEFGNPAWVLGDIGDAVLPRKDNDFAFIAAGSFGHLVLEIEQQQALHNIHGHLKAGGTVALHLSLAVKESQRWMTRGPFEAISPSASGARVRKVFVRNRYDAEKLLFHIHDKIEIYAGNDVKTFEYVFSMRHFTPEEVSHLLIETGFGNIRMYGDYELNEWEPGSPEWIVCGDSQL